MKRFMVFLTTLCVIGSFFIMASGDADLNGEEQTPQDVLVEEKNVNNSPCSSEDFDARLKTAIRELSIKISMTMPGYTLSNYYEIRNKYKEFSKSYYSDPNTVVVLIKIFGYGVTEYHISMIAVFYCETGALRRIGAFGPYTTQDIIFPPERWIERPVSVKDPNVLPNLLSGRWVQTEWSEGHPDYYHYILVID